MTSHNDELPPSYDSVCNYNASRDDKTKKTTDINKKVFSDMYEIEDNYSHSRRDLRQDPQDYSHSRRYLRQDPQDYSHSRRDSRQDYSHSRQDPQNYSQQNYSYQQQYLNQDPRQNYTSVIHNNCLRVIQHDYNYGNNIYNYLQPRQIYNSTQANNSIQANNKIQANNQIQANNTYTTIVSRRVNEYGFTVPNLVVF